MIKYMKILAIETSCDDTCIAITENDKVLADFVSSQTELHAKYGGVHPSEAKREHEKNIFGLLKKSLKKANLLKEREKPFFVKKETEIILERYPKLYKDLKDFLEKYEKPEISKIAVTIGPGLEPCLWVGINLARALALNWKIKLIPINHIGAHILISAKDAPLPALCLVVSGGTTELFLMKKSKYILLGQTRDDAAGECFDKTARLLGLAYPGGPSIYEKAKNTTSSKIKLPRPMIYSKDYDFSFSGLKTAVLYETKKGRVNKKEFAFEIQNSIIDILIHKTEKAIKEFSPKSIILGGGVSANEELRKRFKTLAKRYKKEIFIPKPKYSMDNAVMIAIASTFSKKEVSYRKIKPNANLKLND